MTKFKPVSSQVDFPVLERELLEYWNNKKIVEKYLKKNNSSEKKFSFLDGPITANNPMGVHHGWSRTYKDLWERFFNMHGYKQRFQNGFDEQGLWVEVNVEKDFVITGGIAKNTGVTSRVEKELKITALPRPAKFDPQLAGAIGAALFAKALVERGK